MTTTQDLRALIARLQARLDGGNGKPYEIQERYGEDGELLCHQMICPHYPGSLTATIADDDPAGLEDALTMQAALAELPAQIARWLARLDEADRLNAEAIRSREVGAYGMAGDERKEADTLLATVTEDVQAWAGRLGVGDG